MRTNLSILCVDDDQGVLRSLKRILMSADYSVGTAASGLEALAKLKNDPSAFQVVITDLRMPGLVGIALIKQARTHGYTGEFVIVTGSIEDYDRSQFRGVGVRLLFEKPADPAALLEAVQQLERT